MDDAFAMLVTRVMTVACSYVLMTAMTRATAWMASVCVLRASLETPAACRTAQVTAKRTAAASMEIVIVTRDFSEMTALWVRFIQERFQVVISDI